MEPVHLPPSRLERRRRHRQRVELAHLPALDGIRGLAVAAVLVYHAGFAWARGGFLGVSSFFTLSGFLITSLLLVEWRQTGRIDLLAFWSRRARRLLPALLAALALVLGLGLTAGSTWSMDGFRGDVWATLGYVLNWRFVLRGETYSAYLTASSPLQHCWSLAVEEQFYLLFPPLLLAGLTMLGRRRWSHVRRGLAAGFATITAGSALLGAVLVKTSGIDRVYFGTDTRAADLLIGALLAVAVVPRLERRDAADERPPRGVDIAGWVALGAVLAAWVWVPERSTWFYQGGLAGYAVASFFVVSASTWGGTVARALSWRPLPALGRISYGVYLYHWPIYLWLDGQRTGLDRWPLFTLRAAVTLAVATVSYVAIEQPIRRGQLGAREARVAFATGAVALAALAPIVVTRHPPPAQDVRSGRRVEASAHHRLAQVASPAKPTLHKVLLVGDSVMHQAATTFASALPGVQVFWVGHDAWGPLAHQGEVLDRVRQAVAAFHPDEVLFSFSGAYLTPHSDDDEPFHLADGTEVPPDTDLMYRAWRQECLLLVQAASVKGARVLWATGPVVEPSSFFGEIAPRSQRLNQIYRHLPTVRVVDWYGLTAPQGQWSATLRAPDGTTAVARQPDGLHFTPFGNELLVRAALPALLAGEPKPTAQASGP